MNPVAGPGEAETQENRCAQRERGGGRNAEPPHDLPETGGGDEGEDRIDLEVIQGPESGMRVGEINQQEDGSTTQRKPACSRKRKHSENRERQKHESPSAPAIVHFQFGQPLQQRRGQALHRVSCPMNPVDLLDLVLIRWQADLSQLGGQTEPRDVRRHVGLRVRHERSQAPIAGGTLAPDRYQSQDRHTDQHRRPQLPPGSAREDLAGDDEQDRYRERHAGERASDGAPGQGGRDHDQPRG